MLIAWTDLKMCYSANEDVVAIDGNKRTCVDRNLPAVATNISLDDSKSCCIMNSL